MRHERIAEAEIAAWPRTLETIAPTFPEGGEFAVAMEQALPVRPAAAAPDVAAGVGGLIVASYVSLILVFFAFFAGSLESVFVISIAALFLAVFFTVPRLFFKFELDDTRRPSLPAFMERGLETLTGHSSGRDAIIQMIIVPVLLTLGLLAMGIVGKIYL